MLEVGDIIEIRGEKAVVCYHANYFYKGLKME